MSDAAPPRRPRMHLGVQLWPQYATWPQLLEAARLADDLGYDSLWTWDHLLPVYGPADGDYFEGWQLVAAWGALTKNLHVGTLVSAVTLRQPAILAKMAVTLDHITGGRAILGMGAAWMEAEHATFGIPFGPIGVRLRRLEEAAVIVRSLLERPRTSFDGTYYRIIDAPAEPKPVRGRLPLLIGGTGERRTLRIVARYADMWHHRYTDPTSFAAKMEVLRRYCREIGRDPGEILPMTGAYVLVRDGADVLPAVGRWREALARTHRTAAHGFGTPIAGDADTVAERIFAYARAGARGFVIGMGAPFDLETMRRIAVDVWPRLERLLNP